MRSAGFYWVKLEHPERDGDDPLVVARWDPDYFGDGAGAFVYDGSWYLDGQAAKCLSGKRLRPPGSNS